MHQGFRSIATALALTAAFGVAGCGVLKPAKPKTNTVGERIPVLNFETKVEAEPELKDTAVVLPPPEANADWGQTGGSAAKSGGHLALPDTLSHAWTVSIGKGSTSRHAA